MREHPTEERLNDHVDGLLPAAEQAAVEAHLAACAACRAEVEGLRALLREVAGLPRELAPPAGVWEALREETAPPRARWTVRATRRELAAAAVLLVALSSGITAALVRDRGGPASAPVATAPGPRTDTGGAGATLVALAGAEAEYARTAEELEAVLRARRDLLAPETVRVVEESLRVIDEAIADARGALEQDPASAELSNVLATTYRDKIDVLERTLRLSQT